MKIYKHEHGKKCPVTNKKIEPYKTINGKLVIGTTIFSIKTRKNWPYNACTHCHIDKRSIGQRLHDINKERSENENL